MSRSANAFKLSRNVKRASTSKHLERGSQEISLEETMLSPVTKIIAKQSKRNLSELTGSECLKKPTEP